MTKIPVVFTFDKRIVLGAAVTIKSLIDTANPDTEYDIYVYHPDIDEKTANEFKKMTDGTRHSITFECISPEKFKDAPINKGGSWTEIVYYRLLVPELLPQYDKVIYSDVDVLIKSDLSELYYTDISGFEFAAVRAERNHPNMIGHKYFEENKNEFIFWSGLMLINCTKFRKEKIFNKLIDNAKIFYNRLKFFDLDLVNITCDKIFPLPLKYCVLQCLNSDSDYREADAYKYLSKVYSDTEIENAIKDTAIVHYAGKPGKPWRFKKMPADFKECLDTIPKPLKRLTFRDFRKRLFSKV